MGRRLTAWALTLPVAATGVLVAHDLAYRITGVGEGQTHAYLAHAPQVLAILFLLGVCGLAIQSRGGSPSTAPFVLLAVGGFVVQEHVERLAHGGSLPFLLADRTFLLGLLLQIPVAAVCALIVRRVLVALRAPLRRLPPRLPQMLLDVVPPSGEPAAARLHVAPRGRAPPLDPGR